MDYGETVPPEGLQELEKVNAAAVRLSGLIDSLLEMARLGKAEVRKSRLDLTAICRQLEEELRRRDFAPVEVEIQPDMLLEGDPVLISVLMQNLMENAYKFCEQGGEGKVWVGTEDREGERVYFVRDNGVGFDSVYAGKIFQPFERLHRNEEFAGTGMGLANAKRIIERHGGRIWAEGRPGAGACFFFTVG
jgi:light-regulated signal transduction histidine kinase (bacteriophytochrome)